MTPDTLRVVWVTGWDAPPTVTELPADAEFARGAGARCVWLRQPAWTSEARLETVRRLKSVGWSVIVGRDLAAAREADGLQCGAHGPFPTDGTPFGVSVHGVEEAVRAADAGARWIVAGPIRDTRKGVDIVAGRGFAWLETIARTVACPTVAVGGLFPRDLREATAAGAVGVAGVSAFRRS